MQTLVQVISGEMYLTFCCMLSNGRFAAVWSLYAKVSEHSVPYSKADRVFRNVGI
jgi:hypothetical protein